MTPKQTRIGMIVFSYYPEDPRVRREAEALVEDGHSVDVICLRNEAQASVETVDGVTVHRLPLQRKRGSKFRYLWEYAVFLLLSFIKVTRLHFKRFYKVVHVHNMPDVLVFAGLVPRLLGAKVVLDLHDPMPEVYMTKYSIGLAHPIIRILVLCERLSIRFASLVLTPNIAFQNLFISRGCPAGKIHVIMNSPDEKVFRNRAGSASAAEAGAFKMMYHGTIVERHGLSTALEAVRELKGKIPGLEFHIFGEGDYVEPFLDRVRALDLQDQIRYHGFVRLEDIAARIPEVDLGIIPNHRTPFTEINMPTRVFEYLSMGKPVISPRTRGILDYFGPDSLFFFEPGDARDLAAVIQRVYENQEQRKRILKNGMAIYQNHKWEQEKTRLKSLVRRLIDGDRHRDPVYENTMQAEGNE